MLRRLSLLFFAALICGAFSTAVVGCAHPYSGKSQRLKKPRKKKRPKKEKADETAKVEWDDKCRTDFFDKPTKRRSPRSARALSKKATSMLLDAESQEESGRVRLVIDAINKLRSALKKDPYGPEPTYRLAVAYALVAKKGCALELLKRLAALKNHPDVEKEANRKAKQAAGDPAFDGFKKEAEAALGE